MTAGGQGRRQAGDAGIGFGAFIRTATRVPLLEAREEADLGKRIQAGVAAQRMLDEQELSPSERRQLRRIVADGRRASNRLVHANVRLAINMARRFSSAAAKRAAHEYGIEERVQEAFAGLMRAAEKFDPAKGYRFTTYASWWVRQALQRGAMRTGSVRLPAHVWDDLANLWTARHEILDAGGILRPGPLSMVSGLPRAKVESLLELEPHISAVRLDRPVGREGSFTLSETLADRSDGPGRTALDRDAARRLRAHLTALDERDRRVIEMRFGLDGGPARTLQEVGDVLDLTRERVRQLQNLALERLQQSDELRNLHEWALEERQ